MSAPAFAELAADQRVRTHEFPARRGAILDRNGEPLAISIDLKTIYADPALVENARSEAEKLAPVLDLDVDAATELLNGRTPESRFEFIARQVPPKVAKKVAALELPGVHMYEEARRYYPGGRLASHILGFTDTDGNGISGIESEYEHLLKGKAGRETLEQDPAGNSLPQADSTYEAPRPGHSLFLTIDKDIQYFTELTLTQATKQYGAIGGTAIVMKPDTGEILALANVPDFSPNRPGDFATEAFRNRAVTDVYEPGSAFKIVTASAALEQGLVTPETSFLVPDALAYYDRVFNDSHAHATMPMTVSEIIEQSSNVGTIKIALNLGAKLLDQFVYAFGFGAETGLGFPGESSGILLDRKDWSGTTIATVPIGQGIAVTPMQMALAYCVLANDGEWIAPRLLASTMDERGDVDVPPSPPARTVISAETATTMSEILARVVEKGTGIEAQIPGYAVAGKTGTAQKASPEGGYGNSYVASFAGFAPADDPAIVVLVVLDEPTPIWGGSTAAPTFKLITEFTLRHLGIAPTENAEKAAAELEAEMAGDPAIHD
ncbi:MAG TPA: penicillin-binding protein 2 [Actinomycetota bacterium]|nr:penicillin-binding protein 2 [Actinomycetota bacterium]